MAEYFLVEIETGNVLRIGNTDIVVHGISHQSKTRWKQFFREGSFIEKCTCEKYPSYQSVHGKKITKRVTNRLHKCNHKKLTFEYFILVETSLMERK